MHWAFYRTAAGSSSQSSQYKPSLLPVRVTLRLRAIKRKTVVMRAMKPVETAAPRNIFQSPFQLGGHAWSMEVWRGRRKVISVTEMTKLDDDLQEIESEEAVRKEKDRRKEKENYWRRLDYSNKVVDSGPSRSNVTSGSLDRVRLLYIKQRPGARDVLPNFMTNH